MNGSIGARSAIEAVSPVDEAARLPTRRGSVRAHPHHPGRPWPPVWGDDGRLRDETTFLAMLSESELQQGHLTGAMRLAMQALEREDALHGERVLGPHYVSGAVLAERNDLRGAMASLEMALRRAGAFGAPCCRLLPALTLAMVRHAAGDPAGGWAALDDAAIEHGDEPMLAGWIVEARATLLLREGDLDGAAVAVAALADPARSRLAARVHAKRGNRAATLGALRRVPRVGRRDQLEHLLLRARGATDDDERSRLVHDALTIGEPDDYVSTFADEAEWIVPSLRRLEEGWGSRYAAKLLATVTTLDLQAPAREDEAHVAAPDLSPREWEVLGYLETRLSTREIGRELFISRNTVKTHIRSIYLKLGVQNRLEARSWRQQQSAPGSS